ncbi:MAG TPA: hypothetical protein VEC56_00960 [Candidatus Krumholzibacteria bacterium]|nr:hypothetical protein [Candidatus Krumholzibacteria bacterium]
MRPRHPYSSIALAIAVALCASCAASPPRRDATPEIQAIRDDYLRANPDVVYKDAIARGEVVVGMGYQDVLAAWGRPTARVVQQGTDDAERWTYVLVSDNGTDWVRYDFFFAKWSVVQWETTRSVASGFAPARDDARGVSTRVPPMPAPAALGEGVRKGGAGSMIR